MKPKNIFTDELIKFVSPLSLEEFVSRLNQLSPDAYSDIKIVRVEGYYPDEQTYNFTVHSSSKYSRGGAPEGYVMGWAHQRAEQTCQVALTLKRTTRAKLWAFAYLLGIPLSLFLCTFAQNDVFGYMKAFIALGIAVYGLVSIFRSNDNVLKFIQSRLTAPSSEHPSELFLSRDTLTDKR